MTTVNKSFYKRLFKLAAPISLQALITFSIGLSDVIMIGRLGDNAISSVYVGNQVQTLLTFFIAGVEGAILAISAQYWGCKDNNTIKRIFTLGLLISVAVSLILTILCISAPEFVVSIFTNKKSIIKDGAEYLSVIALSFLFFSLTNIIIATMRSVESAKIGFVSSLFALAINLIFNYALIFGKLGAPRLEVRGAGIATLIARIAECLFVTVYLIFIDKKLKIRIKDLKIDKEIAMQFLKYGSPIILGQIVWSINLLFASAVIGWQKSSEGTAAMSIASSLGNLSYVVTNGISGSLGVITGKSIGEGNIDYVKSYSKKAQILFIALGALTAIIMQLLKNPFISIYNISPPAIKMSRKFINMLSITATATCYQSAVLFGLLKSGGDTKFVLKTEAIAVFLFVIPSAIIASRLGAPLPIIYLFLKIDQFIKCFPAAIRLNKFKWIKNIASKS